MRLPRIGVVPRLGALGPPGPVPLAARVLVLACGAVLMLVPTHLDARAAVLTVLATVLAAAAPRTIGSLAPSAVFVLAWLGSTGWHGHPSLTRTVTAALALYVLHQACALAACLPWDADVAPGVVGAWARRATGPLLAGALVVAGDLVLPSTTSAVVEFAGLVGVVLLAGAATVAVLRRDRSSLE